MTQSHSLTIISGGQTGVDRGALDAALHFGAPCSGWCPEGRIAEDGRIPERYPLIERAGAGYRERTRANVETADATLVIYFGALSGGTKLTVELCRQRTIPCCLIDARVTTSEEAARGALHFLRKHAARRINIAGPRASACAEAYDYARQTVRRLLEYSASPIPAAAPVEETGGACRKGTADAPGSE